MGRDELGSREPTSISRSDLHDRAWALILLDAASRNGLVPISKLRYHRLAYLANGLSQVYGFRAADERIVKHRRGPFYPDLQWHLDRLLGQLLIQVSHIRHYVDDYGAWMEAEYALRERAASVIDELCRLERVKRLSLFLIEVAGAYAAQEDEALDSLVLSDVMYAHDSRALNSVIQFSRSMDNLSARTAESFAWLAPSGMMLAPQDKISLYIEYIDRRHAGGAV